MFTLDEMLSLVLDQNSAPNDTVSCIWREKVRLVGASPKICEGFRSPGNRNHWWKLFSVASCLYQNLHCAPPCEPSSPPVCPCSSKTSLTPPISTLGSFWSSFRPPNLSFHFPRYFLITFFSVSELLHGFLDTLFSPVCPCLTRLANCIAYSAVR